MTAASSRAAAFSSIHPHTVEDDFRTPRYILDYVSRLRPITHDGACSVENSVAEPFDLWGDDRLPSGSHLWINPPWRTDDVVRFVERSHEVLMMSSCSRITFLLPNKLCETKWLDRVMPHFDYVCFLGGRVNFEGPHSVKGGATRWGTIIAEISRKVPAPIPILHYRQLRDLKSDFAARATDRRLPR